MAKVILFARVSSDKQSYERQISDLMPLIKADGYSENDVAIIQHKESAIKNDVQNRKSIAELKDLISKNQIESLYLTEISRLARRNDVLYNVLAMLEEHHICLVVQQPMLIRTIVDGNPNPMAHVIIAFMNHLAVSEGVIKAERQASGLRQKIKEGRICNRTVKFGYRKDKSGHAVIDDSQANVVINCFNMYLDGKSTGWIWDYYKHSGVFPNLNDKSGQLHVYKILTDVTYIGEHGVYQYPQLIENELFEKVQKKLSDNNKVKQLTKYVYYCTGLIKYKGRTFSPSGSIGYKLTIGHEYYQLNVNCIDYLARMMAVRALSSMSSAASEKRKENALESIRMTKMKLNGIEKDIKDNEEEQNRINYMFQKGKYTVERYEYEIARVEGELKHMLNEKEYMAKMIVQLNAVINSDASSYLGQMKSYNNLLEIEDDKEIQRMVHEAIESINLERTDEGWIIRFDYKDKSLNIGEYYRYFKYGCRTKLLACMDGDDAVEDWSGSWPMRIVRTKKREQ